ncbi:MAG: hypothetical protein [Microviridae sp.]|nr:MAG: hypothetical protein [Microviridae sp.]
MEQQDNVNLPIFADATDKQNLSLEGETNPTSKRLFEQTKIHNTPFTAVKMDDKWFLTMGKYRLTNTLTSLKECEAEATDTSWERIMQIIQIMIEENKTDETQMLKEQIEALKKQIH